MGLHPALTSHPAAGTTATGWPRLARTALGAPLSLTRHTRPGRLYTFEAGAVPAHPMAPSGAQ